MEHNRGSSGVIFVDNNDANFVIKRTKKDNIELEFQIHQTCYDLYTQQKYKILKIPKPIYINKKSYKMEKIQDNVMIVSINEGSLLYHELLNFFESLYENYKICAFDFELFQQNDGSVCLIDFDKFSLNKETFENSLAPLLSPQSSQSVDKTTL